jgi:hypothetical protein
MSAGHSAAEAVRGRKFNSGPLAGVARLILTPGLVRRIR